MTSKGYLGELIHQLRIGVSTQALLVEYGHVLDLISAMVIPSIKTSRLSSQRAYTVYISYARMRHKVLIDFGWFVVDDPKIEFDA